MYVNDRDQINYHGFLRALREMNQVSQEAVGKGICTVSGMNRFENGNRIAEKLMRDRLTARLGISGEKYEDYLQPKEYVKWEHRLRIVKAIEKKDFALARMELDAYRELPRLNCVNLQFVEAMHFMILSAENAPKEEQLACITNAVKCTIPNMAKALNGEHLLSDQEINLIAEYMRLCPAKKTIKDEIAWRISEYEKLIAYMDVSCWEKLQKAKVYPKVVYYICQLMQEGGMTGERCRRGLELCHQAIELLRDTCRLYYFIELTEIRRLFAEFLLECGAVSVDKEELEAMLQQNASWENVFKELYTEYKVEPYMSDFCYLYYETECHDMVEVIETRRNMLGLSRVKLGEGICTDKTIIRFEREGRNPNIDLVRLLFERMGLCAEYRRAQIIVSDSKSLMLYLELISKVNGFKNEAAQEILLALEKAINMDVLYNKQEVDRVRNLLALRRKKIDRREIFVKSVATFESTISIKAMEKGLKNDKVHLTRAELMCAHDIAFYGDGKSARVCKEYIKQQCDCMIKTFKTSLISESELLITRLASELGDVGNFMESIFMSKFIMKECLTCRRANILSENLYNIFWNIKENEHNSKIDLDYKKELERCICISNLTKATDWGTFFQNKLKELSD